MLLALDLCVRCASRLVVAQLFAVALISLETADRMKCFIKIDPIYSRDIFVLGTDRNSMSLIITFQLGHATDLPASKKQLINLVVSTGIHQ